MSGRQTHASRSSSPPGHRVPGLGHTPALDGLRGVAIILVLAHNLDVLDIARTSPVAVHVVKELLYLGWIGVQLFFVLSGYLITRGLIAAQGGPGYFRDFYIKRSLRIFPLYFLSLLAFTWLLPTVWPQVFGPILPGDRWLWLYLSNWTEPLGLGGGERLPHFWSLAVEEQFYLVWPLLLYRRTPRQVLIMSLLVTLAGPLIRWEVLQAGYGHEALYSFTVCRMDSLAIGAALAAWHVMLLQSPARAVTDPEVRTKLTASVWLIGLLSMATAAVTSHGFQRIETQSQVWSYSVLGMAFVLLLGASVEDMSALRLGRLRRPSAAWLTDWPYAGVKIWQRVLSGSVLRAFGKYSYALYVFHKPLHDLLGPKMLIWMGAGKGPVGLGSALAYLGVMTALTFGMALLSWRWLEKPMLGLRHRLIRPRLPKPPAAAADGPPTPRTV